jgi:ABC-type uncharacterized transport system permease subunit
VRGHLAQPAGHELSRHGSFPRIRHACRRSGRQPGRANWGFVFALVAAVVVWFMLSKTLKGFEVKVLGQPARRPLRRLLVIAHGVLRFPRLRRARRAGRHIGSLRRGRRSSTRSISPGYGFTAIIVAFLGRLNPLGIVVAGLVLALTYLGGEAASISLGMSDKVVRAFQGMLLFFVLACDTLIHYKIRLVRTAAARTAEA